jgi:superfamily II DNA helicase RecQ
MLRYHTDAVGKDSILSDFKFSRKRVIVATNVLGICVDIPDVRCVIVHVMGAPVSFKSYRPQIITSSSSEAEFFAFTYSAKETA